ncbi:uncharacterized protein KY384_001269 [Bacidia gigantensis]|uniref:uncharacterized protein n=1 Tax=Bacidia gigantensis TaxID=2732470 RepID=UPI001D03D486|nr:uncharacterized protein KY384_001269 [Bacidia gigantensis]KAG8533529.1 hypothetical protein KY384_001269 [Bacidia gigantensis]
MGANLSTSSFSHWLTNFTIDGVPYYIDAYTSKDQSFQWGSNKRAISQARWAAANGVYRGYPYAYQYYTSYNGDVRLDINFEANDTSSSSDNYNANDTSSSFDNFNANDTSTSFDNYNANDTSSSPNNFNASGSSTSSSTSSITWADSVKLLDQLNSIFSSTSNQWLDSLPVTVEIGLISNTSTSYGQNGTGTPLIQISTGSEFLNNVSYTTPDMQMTGTYDAARNLSSSDTNAALCAAQAFFQNGPGRPDNATETGLPTSWTWLNDESASVFDMKFEEDVYNLPPDEWGYLVTAANETLRVFNQYGYARMEVNVTRKGEFAVPYIRWLFHTPQDEGFLDDDSKGGAFVGNFAAPMLVFGSVGGGGGQQNGTG